MDGDSVWTVAHGTAAMQVMLADAVPGMVLRAAATNHQGQVLLPAGAEISAKHLRILRSWGVRGIEVEDPASAGGGAVNADTDRAVEAVAARFRRVREDPVLEQIMIALQGRARSGS